MHLLIRVFTLGVCATVGLLGCDQSQQSTERTKQLNQNTQYQLNNDCAPLIKTFDSCPVSRLPKQNQQHMMAVLEEQMRALSAAEASKKCQELQNFWQVACGVAIAQ